jgi:hypothetical protein
MNRRAKHIALLAAAAGLMVLAAAGLVGKDWARERWYLHVLDGSDEGAKKDAAWELAGLGSLVALPGFVRVINDPTSTVSLRNRMIAAIHRLGLAAVPSIAEGLRGEADLWKRIREVLSREPTSLPEEQSDRFFELSNALSPFGCVGSTTGVGLTPQDYRRDEYWMEVFDALLIDCDDGFVTDKESAWGRGAMILGGRLWVRAPLELLEEVTKILQGFEGTFPFHWVFDSEMLDGHDIPMLIALLKDRRISPFWHRCILSVIKMAHKRIGNPVAIALEAACRSDEDGARLAAAEALKKIQGTQDEPPR